MIDAYEYWKRAHGDGWGLAWFLAAELVSRFHASHGLRAVVIHRDGLGYYGIALQHVPCRVHRQRTALGRLTMSGDVENWITGGPGGHGRELTARAEREPVAQLVPEAIAHLQLPPVPTASHLGCRHHRWGASAALVFRLTARLALRHDQRVHVDHDRAATRAARGLEADADQGEHPGYTMLRSGGKRVVLVNDGRVLEPEAATSL